MVWNKELLPQLENFTEIRDVEAYLRGVTFGRKLLGCDPDEVQECLSEVSRQYKLIIASLLSRQGQDAQIQDLQESLARMSQENAAQGEWIRWYEQANAALLADNELLRQENAAPHAGRIQYY